MKSEEELARELQIEKEIVEIKAIIWDCPIYELKQLAIMMQAKDSMKFDITKVFNLQTKEVLKEQVKVWKKILIEKEKYFKENKALDRITELNQNELFFNSEYTNKEFVYQYYLEEIGIEYYKNCIQLMKNIIKNK